MKDKYNIIISVVIFLGLILGIGFLINDANETIKPRDYKAALEQNRLNTVENEINTETKETNALANTDISENPKPNNTSTNNTYTENDYKNDNIKENIVYTNSSLDSNIEINSNNYIEIHNDTTEESVWIGETGTKYHRSNCRTLRGNKYQITLQEAINQGREPCKVCNP